MEVTFASPFLDYIKHKPKFNTRKGLSPIVSSTLLVGVTLILTMSMSVFYSDFVSAQCDFTALEFLSATSTVSETVGDAKWEVIFALKNSGTKVVVIEKLSVSNIPVTHYGVSPGDSLESSHVIGTSIPDDFLVLDPGKTIVVKLWIGEDLFSHGTNVLIQVLNVNSTDIVYNVVLV